MIADLRIGGDVNVYYPDVLPRVVSSLLLQLPFAFIDISNSASIAMSTLSNWLQPDYYIEHINVLSRIMKTESVINTLRLTHVDNPHLIIYGALIVTAALYLAGRHIRKNASLSIRPRTPDPEKKPVDVSTFAAKRMNPTQRPPGSKSNPPPHSRSPY